MSNKITFKFFLGAILFISLLISCDKDYNSLGSDLVQDDHFGFLSANIDVTAYNEPYTVVQTNNLPVNSLGIYNNPVFGKTRASFVTQVQMSSVNPTFDETMFVNKEVKFDSVVLAIPYFDNANKRTSNSDGSTSYVLDSIINASKSINLSVYENTHYINDLDPANNSQTSYKYYNNDKGSFEPPSAVSKLNNDADVKQNIAFVPSSKQIIQYKRQENAVPYTEAKDKTTANIEARLTPRMYLKLNADYFTNRFMPNKSAASFLKTQNEFTNEFKGLYFKVEDATDGNLMRLDFSKGTITCYYHEYTSSTEKNPTKCTSKSIVLNLTGRTINFIEHSNSANYDLFHTAIPDKTNGDATLALKGGANGGNAIIEFFRKDLHGEDGMTGAPNGIIDSIDFRNNKGKIVINEANLVFYVDQDKMKTSTIEDGTGEVVEPLRIYLYNYKKKQAIFDYGTDVTTVTTYPKYSKYILGGLLEQEKVYYSTANPSTYYYRGLKYKLRITNHIRNLMNYTESEVLNDNEKLGLVVTEGIGFTGNYYKKNGTYPEMPVANIMNPLGTFLYGSNTTSDKKVKLEIFYSKIN